MCMQVRPALFDNAIIDNSVNALHNMQKMEKPEDDSSEQEQLPVSPDQGPNFIASRQSAAMAAELGFIAAVESFTPLAGASIITIRVAGTVAVGAAVGRIAEHIIYRRHNR